MRLKPTTSHTKYKAHTIRLSHLFLKTYFHGLHESSKSKMSIMHHMHYMHVLYSHIGGTNLKMKDGNKEKINYNVVFSNIGETKFNTPTIRLGRLLLKLIFMFVVMSCNALHVCLVNALNKQASSFGKRFTFWSRSQGFKSTVQQK